MNTRQEKKQEDAFLLGVEGENAAAPQRKTKGEAFHHQVTETEQAWEGGEREKPLGSYKE